MERSTTYTQQELDTFMFRNINTAYKFSQEVIEGMQLGPNESLYVDIYPEIDYENVECWYVAFYIIQHYNVDDLLNLSKEG